MCWRYYEAWQCSRKTCIELCGEPCYPQRPGDEGVAQKDQKETWSQDSKGSGDAETGNDYLAHAPMGQAIPIPLRPADTRTETKRPSVAKGGFSRHKQQESFPATWTRQNAPEMPRQDKGVSLNIGTGVDPSYSLASCSSAVLPPLHRTRTI